MIPFEIDKVTIEHHWLKACTTALGGSITVLDTERSSEDDEVYTRIPFPLAAARLFIKRHEMSKFITPVLSAVTFYDGHAVAIEMHPLGALGEEVVEGLHGPEFWVSESEKNLDKMLFPLTQNGLWFTDGAFAYTLTVDDIADAEHLSEDGRFRAVSVRAIKFSNMHTTELLFPDDRTCLSYHTANGKSAMSPPIWKSLSSIGQRQLDRMDEDGQLEADIVGTSYGTFQFDRVNEFLAVNLAFALKAGREVANVFGYDSIEPLGLDRLMVQLKTVNLPRVDKAVKQTFDIGMPFTHAAAWLIGLTSRTNTLESYMVLRSVLKYLTTKGVYAKNSFNPNAVFRHGQSMDSVELRSLEDLQKEAEQLHGRVAFVTQRRTETEIGSIGNLFGAE